MHFKIDCQNINNILLKSGNTDLDVYWGTANSFADKIPVFINYLSDNEKARANRFKHKSDFNCYISVHALLRIELSKLLETDAKSIRIEASQNGKPFTYDVDLPFSLSRAKNLFAFVIGRSNQLLGIDIEQIKSGVDFTGISRNYFSVKEQQRILLFESIADQSRFFFEIWTRKEALLKAVGVGINTDLSKVQVLEGKNEMNIEGVQTDADKFKISTIMNSGTIISIASSVDFTARLKELSL